MLPWYAAGTLSADEARRVERHVAGCEACRREVEALRSMGATLRRAHGDHAVRRRWTAWVSAAAAVAVLVVGGWLVLREPWAAAGAAPAAAVDGTVVTLTPTLRGADGEPALEGDGPWRVRVLLPATAADGAYRLAWEDGVGTTAATRVRAVASVDGELVVEIVAPPRRGRLRLLVAGTAGAPRAAFEYPVSVRPSP